MLRYKNRLIWKYSSKIESGDLAHKGIKISDLCSATVLFYMVLFCSSRIQLLFARVSSDFYTVNRSVILDFNRDLSF